jgi:hypothetical protein
VQHQPSPQARSDTKLILCMKWGTKYGADYVNRLQRMVARHLSPPFQLVCLSDDPLGLDPAIRVLPLPELGCAEPTNTRGKWRKVALWGAQLDGLRGPALFVDLDSVIVGDLDPYFSHGDPSAVILERNWARPLSGLGQTSVFRFPIGSHPEILERFRRDPQAIADRFGYEQHFISHCLGHICSSGRGAGPATSACTASVRCPCATCGRPGCRGEAASSPSPADPIPPM